MKAETMIKRINTMRKDVIRWRREILREDKYLAEAEKEFRNGQQINIELLREENRKWRKYYSGLIEKKEREIAEASKKVSEIASKEERIAMIEGMIEQMMKSGIQINGYTTNGLRYGIEHNNGITDRSRHCFTMWIEGTGTVFTSGTIETVADYILHN
ncbi:MAG: hypothetical protein J6Q65_04995 [Lentisphaeria bacterium]|nr:hypothetical protein [Lentisphaeria bacterium]